MSCCVQEILYRNNDIIFYRNSTSGEDGSVRHDYYAATSHNDALIVQPLTTGDAITAQTASNLTGKAA